MHSSTSNSEPLPPPSHWRRTWGLTLALVAMALVAVEWGGRKCGIRPSVIDDAKLWSLARASVHEDDLGEVVLVGASRIQLGLDTAVFAHSYGRRPVQLAISGSNCLPVLDDLSRSRFCGTLICEVPLNLFGNADWHGGRAEEYVQAYRAETAAELFEASLCVWVQQHTIFRLPALAPGRVFTDLLKHNGLPKPYYITTLADRSVLADYRRADQAAMLRSREQRTRDLLRGAEAVALDKGLASVEIAVERIQSRGGRVVFVMMPVSEPVRSIAEQRLPRAQYWDVFAARTKAVAIHFADYPQLQFTCPDGSHLDRRDGPAFTRALVEILQQKLAVRSATPRIAGQTNACFWRNYFALMRS